MIGSVSNQGSAGLMTALMKEAVAKQSLAVSVIKKGQDVQKMQGEAALKLIDAAASPPTSGGIDVRV